MINKRSQSGATLALVVACTIIIILVGIGAFFLVQLLGGQRELQHATDAGDLNIAKQAIERPNITLAAAGVVAQNNFSTLTDDRLPGGNSVDLKVYNRLVGQTLLVCMNATAQGTPSAKANARTLLTTLQGGGGIGDRLAQSLGSTNNTGNFFKDLNLSNSTKLIKAQASGTIGRTDVSFAPGWMERRGGDIGATNVRPPFAAQFPANFPTTPASFINAISTNETNKSVGTIQYPVNQPFAGARQYIRGYRGINVPGLAATNLVGVPVQPGRQPHLVSAFDFNTQQNQPVPGTIVPPNSFQQGATQKGQFARNPLEGLSRALVGSLDQDYLPSISGGYIRIVNSLGIPNAASIINTNTVLNNQLDPINGGITIAKPGSGHFSNTPHLISSWEQHNSDPNHQKPHQTVNPPNGSTNDDFPPQFDVTQNGNETYDQNGNKLTSNQAAHSISGSATLCTDRNTFPPSPGRGGNANCNGALDSFERAYTPGYTGQSDWYNNHQPAASGSNLTAIANAKCAVMSQFNSCGSLTVPQTARASGMEYYPCGFAAEQPWPQGPCANAGLKCSISRDGTLRELLSQTGTGNPANNLVNNSTVLSARAFLIQRMSQMNPDRALAGLIARANTGDADRALNCVMPMDGEVRFIFYESGGNRNLIVGSTKLIFNSKLDPNPTIVRIGGRAPVAEGALTAQNPDGQTSIIRRTYNVNGSLVNPHHDQHIHDQMFKCGGRANNLQATERVDMAPSSGFNNLLGEFKFSEHVAGSPYYCCPD
jgi:hypothetical protein